jgi:hypothetical protein
MPKTVIRTPFPTLEEVAKNLGLSKSRVQRLDRMMADIFNANGHTPARTRAKAKKRAAAKKTR